MQHIKSLSNLGPGHHTLIFIIFLKVTFKPSWKRKTFFLFCSVARTHEIEFIDEIEQLEKKAKLSILAVDNHPNIFIETLVDEWGLTKPDIVISVTGSLKHVNIKKGSFHAFQRGLARVVSKTKCWILSGGNLPLYSRRKHISEFQQRAWVSNC